MIIESMVLDQICKATLKADSEIGGILGSKDGRVISNVVMDKGNAVKCACSYKPDTDFINKQISEWVDNEISLKGIFHTHFAGVKTLSEADKEYIITIMNNMPDEIVEMYFPIYVLPNQKLIGYKAVKKDKKIDVLCDDVNIIVSN